MCGGLCTRGSVGSGYELLARYTFLGVDLGIVRGFHQLRIFWAFVWAGGILIAG